MKTEFHHLKLYIVFDNTLYLYIQSNLNFAKEKAESAMEKYNFTKAQVCLKCNDTILITIEKE